MREGSIKKSFDISYNLDYLVVVPLKDIDLLDALTYTFGNTLLFENSVSDVEFLTKFLRKNVVGKLIFVDYYVEYDEIINTLVEEHSIEFVFTGYLGQLSDVLLLQEFNTICDKYDCGMIDKIAFLDDNLYKVVHNRRRNTFHVMLDVERRAFNESAYDNNMVGLLNSGCSNYDSFYNQLSGITLLQDYSVRIFDMNDVTKNFLEEYNIKAKNVKKYDELFYGNGCNLYVNFTSTDPLVFIKSMDLGAPCIVGNNNFLSSDYPTMWKYLVMESDDDVDEIAEKIKGAINNKEKILREYKKYRAEYNERVANLTKRFLGFNSLVQDEVKYEKLLTVVVPVYNTKQYLADCLDSVVAARIDDMEILIINDGSVDDSEVVAKEYLKRYPDLMRYIKQDNQGLGRVRNVGLQQAKGKYLASVDSDDTIDSDFFKEALPYLKENIDIVICDWMSIGEDNNFETAALDWVFEKRKEMEGLLYTTIMPSTCNKIIKRSLFSNNGIKYLEQKYEDLSANPRVLLKANTIKYIRKPYYNYYLRDNSLMRSKINPKEMVDALHFLDTNLKIRKGMLNEEEFKYYTYSWRIEEYVINPLYEMKGKELRTVIDYIDKKIGELMKDIFKSKYYKKMLQGLKSKELRDFIEKRNKSFEEKKFAQFVKETKKPYVITASIIYYGD